MKLFPGGTSDEHSSDEHPESEQFVFIIAGRGVARVGKSVRRVQRVELAASSPLFSEDDELH